MSIKRGPQLCGACGEGSLVTTQGVRSVEYLGKSDLICQKSHKCDCCGAALFDEADVRENRRAWVRFKKQIENVPLGCEIATMRVRANLTQKDAGELFGGGPVAFSKYENDDLMPDGAMTNLLKLAIAYPDTVTRLADVKRKPIRIQVFQPFQAPAKVSGFRGSFELEYFPDFDLGELSMVRTESNSTLSSISKKEGSWKMN